MALNLSDVASVMMEQNKAGFKESGKRRAGKMFNDRAVALVKGKLPFGTGGYAETELGRFVIANLISAAIVKFGYTNPKLLLLAEAGVADATDQALGSLNLEGMIENLMDGIDTSVFTTATEPARDATGSVLRKAADIVDPQTGEVA